MLLHCQPQPLGSTHHQSVGVISSMGTTCSHLVTQLATRSFFRLPYIVFWLPVAYRILAFLASFAGLQLSCVSPALGSNPDTLFEALVVAH